MGNLYPNGAHGGAEPAPIFFGSRHASWMNLGDWASSWMAKIRGPYTPHIPSSLMLGVDECCEIIGCLEMPGGWNRAKVAGRYVGDKTSEVTKRKPPRPRPRPIQTPPYNIPFEVYQSG